MKNIYFLVILFFTVALTGCVNKQVSNSSAPLTNSQGSNIVITTSLDLSNQGLTKVPNYIFSRLDLQDLNLSGNKLDGALPGEIRHLQKLESLNASHNLMTGVPAEIGQLKNLKILNLSYNKLTGLPYELGNLKSLKILNLSGNLNYSKLDLEVIKKSLPNVQIILGDNGKISSQACADLGGEVVNTVGREQKCDTGQTFLGEVDGLRCPCVCCQKQ